MLKLAMVVSNRMVRGGFVRLVIAERLSLVIE